MALSKFSIHFRITIFSILFVLILTVTFLWVCETAGIINDGNIIIIAGLCIIISLLLTVLLSILTMILFIKKLIMVFRNLSDNEELIGLITKLSLLTLISLSITILVPLLLPLIVFGFETDVDWPFDFLILVDVTTNFWCIMLSFEEMNHYYSNICNFCDSKCRKLWSNRVVSKDEKMISKIHSVESNTQNTV